MIGRSLVSAVLAVGLAVSSTVSAAAVEDEIAAIKARLAVLEQQLADQNQVIKEKDRQIQELTENPSVREKPG